MIASSLPVLFPPRLKENLGRRVRKAPANQSLAEPLTAAELCRTRLPPSSLVAETLLRFERQRTNPGLGRRDRGQMGSESATLRFARFGERNATAISAPPEPRQIMVVKGLNPDVAARLNPSSPP
jgi:hypothetical protein